MTTAKPTTPIGPTAPSVPNQPIVAVPDTEYCCDGKISLSIDQIDNYQRYACGTTNWATDYAGRNPVEGVNGMKKSDGSFNPESCRVFGAAAHTLAALTAAVVHNLKQTRRARRPKNRNHIAADHTEQTIPHTTPPNAPIPHPASPTPTRAPP